MILGLVNFRFGILKQIANNGHLTCFGSDWGFVVFIHVVGNSIIFEKINWFYFLE